MGTCPAGSGQVSLGVQVGLGCASTVHPGTAALSEGSLAALFLEQAHLEPARLFVLRTKSSFVAYWTRCYFIQAELFQQLWLCSQIKDYHEKWTQSTDWAHW